MRKKQAMMYATTRTSSVPSLLREIDRLFANNFPAGRSEWSPAVDIYETNEDLTLAVELPGIQLEDVELTAVDGILTIRGERKEAHGEGDEGRYQLVERTYGSFMRRFHLPQGVDIAKIAANVENGLLQVQIPKAALAQPKKIQVKAVATVGVRAQHVIGFDESAEGVADVEMAAANRSQ